LRGFASYFLIMIRVFLVFCSARFKEARMSIPPLLSSTPPPLEESGSFHNHEDDFGEFSDHASVGAVSSTTSITDSSSMFRPVEMPGSLYQSDENLKADGFQETDEWSEFDSVAVELSPESLNTDTVGDKLVADGLISDHVSVITPPASILYEGSTDETLSVSPSTSQVIVSEQLELGDVSSGCFADAQVKCNDENSACEEQTVGKFDHDLRETVSEDADPEYRMEESQHDVDEDDEVSFSTGDYQDLEFHNAVDSVEQENNIEDLNGFQISSTVAVSDAAEHSFPSDNQTSSDENDFMDDFHSFGNDVEMHQDIVSEEAQQSIVNNEDPAVTSSREQQASPCIETSADSVGTSYNTDPSSCIVADSTTTAREDVVISASEYFTHEQILASNEEVSDDFDDFEEFVAAKEGPAEHQPFVDSGAYHWNAFENTDADGDDWAAFQESDQPVSAVSQCDISNSNSAFTPHSFRTYSGQLSTVHNFSIVSKFLRPNLTHLIGFISCTTMSVSHQKFI